MQSRKIGKDNFTNEVRIARLYLFDFLRHGVRRVMPPYIF